MTKTQFENWLKFAFKAGFNRGVDVSRSYGNQFPKSPNFKDWIAEIKEDIPDNFEGEQNGKI